MTPSRPPAKRRASVSEPVQLPKHPNYLQLDSGRWIGIESVTDAGLRQLGKLWTEALVRKARTRRKAAK